MPFDGTEFGRRDLLLDKLDRVVDLLSTEDKWCKQRLRTGEGRRCILGALSDVGAEAALAKAILGAVHEVTGKSFSRIDRFNDHPNTDHRLVLAVLGRAREDIWAGKVVAASNVGGRRAVRAFYAALARLGW